MKRSSISWSVKQISTMINKGTITFDNPLQRPSGQWKEVDESLLIDSSLRLFIPDVYVIKRQKEIDDKIINIYDVIDGNQRLHIFEKFKSNKLKLSPLEEITLDTGDTYDISGLTYSDLHEDVRDAINGYMMVFRVIELEEGDDEEAIVNQIFYRINNGKPVSREHLAYVAAPKNVQNFIHDKLTNDPLFTTSAHFPEGSIKKSERQIAIMQSIALAGGYDWNTFGTKDIEILFSNLEVDEEVLKKVSTAFNMISRAFPKYDKFVKKVNIVAFVSLIVNNEFNDNIIPFLQSYSKVSAKGDVYRKFCDSSGTSKDQVNGRIKGLQTLYDAFVME